MMLMIDNHNGLSGQACLDFVPVYRESEEGRSTQGTYIPPLGAAITPSGRLSVSCRTGSDLRCTVNAPAPDVGSASSEQEPQREFLEYLGEQLETSRRLPCVRLFDPDSGKEVELAYECAS